MTADDTDGFDYLPVVIETLREAGGIISDEELWNRVMRRADVPADDRRLYSTPPFEPGPYPRNMVMVKVTMSLMSHTDARGRRPDAPLISTEEGYWLPEWGPIPLIEQQRRAEIDEEWARRASEPTPKVWPELDPYPKSSKAGEDELHEVAEKLVKHRSLVDGQRMVGPGSLTLKRAMEKRLEADGKLDEARRLSAERDRMIGVLMEWYGDAVRRTDGADPQDLFALMRIGFIRNPEKTQTPMGREPQGSGTGPHAPRPSDARKTAAGSSAAAQNPRGGSSGCYIATAVYGSYDAPEVLTLRRYRDEAMLQSSSGRTLVRAYYLVSPPVAKRLRYASLANRVVRAILDGVVKHLESRSGLGSKPGINH